MTYLFLILFLDLMYRFITGFIIPVSRATKTMRSQFGDMKERMEEMRRQQHPQQPPAANEKPKYDVDGEYIPFEEVK